MVERRRRPNVPQPDGRRFTDQQFLTVQEIADRLGFTESFVRKLLRARHLPHYTIGSDIRIDVIDIEVYLAACRVASSDDA